MTQRYFKTHIALMMSGVLKKSTLFGVKSKLVGAVGSQVGLVGAPKGM
jgi:hypothetical protein